MKKKSIKNVILGILMIIILLSLTACGNDSNHKTQNENNENQENESSKMIFEDIKEAMTNLQESKNVSYEWKQDNVWQTKKVKDNKISLDSENTTYYGDVETQEVYQFYKENKTYTKLEVEEYNFQMMTVFSNFPMILSEIMSENIEKDKVKIEEEKLYDTECYKISYKFMADEYNMVTWVDKNTNLPIKSVDIDKDGNFTNEYYYEIVFGEVEDSDVNFDESLLNN